VTWTFRPWARAWRCSAGARTAPVAFHEALAGYAPTPLVELPVLARELGVGRVLVKDESTRLGLPAFKVLGVSWAVRRILDTSTPRALVTASDGNHGWALARVAARHGLGARVYLPDGVRPAVRAAIAAEGATVIDVSGSYDTAVRAAAADADSDGGVLVQDTAWAGYEQIPGWIVEGYLTLFAELDAQLPAGPDLVIVPVGVGSLAQAATSHYRRRALEKAPALLAVEPDAAACLLDNLRHDRLRTVATGATIMTGLNCGTVSRLAWPVLRAGLDAACSVSDRAAAAAAADLVRLGVPAGPCGAASLAAARDVLTDPNRAAQLGVTADSVVVLLCTEGQAANPSREENRRE
jgi:diaminopropionate ammonia-lyase